MGNEHSNEAARTFFTHGPASDTFQNARRKADDYNFSKSNAAAKAFFTHGPGSDEFQRAADASNIDLRNKILRAGEDFHNAFNSNSPLIVLSSATGSDQDEFERVRVTTENFRAKGYRTHQWNHSMDRWKEEYLDRVIECRHFVQIRNVKFDANMNWGGVKGYYDPNSKTQLACCECDPQGKRCFQLAECWGNVNVMIGVAVCNCVLAGNACLFEWRILSAHGLKWSGNTHVCHSHDEARNSVPRA